MGGEESKTHGLTLAALNKTELQIQTKRNNSKILETRRPQVFWGISSRLMGSNISEKKGLFAHGRMKERPQTY